MADMIYGEVRSRAANLNYTGLTTDTAETVVDADARTISVNVLAEKPWTEITSMDDIKVGMKVKIVSQYEDGSPCTEAISSVKKVGASHFDLSSVATLYGYGETYGQLTTIWSHYIEWLGYISADMGFQASGWSIDISNNSLIDDNGMPVKIYYQE